MRVDADEGDPDPGVDDDALVEAAVEHVGRGSTKQAIMYIHKIIPPCETGPGRPASLRVEVLSE